MRIVSSIVIAALALAGCVSFSPGRTDNSRYDTEDERAVRHLFGVWRDATVNGNAELSYKCRSSKYHEAVPYDEYLRDYQEHFRETKLIYSTWEVRTIKVVENEATLIIRDTKGPTTEYVTAVREKDGWKIESLVPHLRPN